MRMLPSGKKRFIVLSFLEHPPEHLSYSRPVSGGWVTSSLPEGAQGHRTDLSATPSSAMLVCPACWEQWEETLILPVSGMAVGGKQGLSKDLTLDSALWGESRSLLQGAQ